MIDLQNPSHCPTLDEVAEYIQNPLFPNFCTDIKTKYNGKEKLEFSSCSWEHGWNIKFKKSGKSLCTVYPRETYFTVLVVVGRKEKESVEAILPECPAEIQELYLQTKEGNGQRWLMIDLEDKDTVYDGLFRLLEIRAQR